MLGALCNSSSHKNSEADEAEKGPRVTDQERLTRSDLTRGRTPWVISVGYRFQPSSRHFVGKTEQVQRQVLGNQIQNTYHLFDVNIERQMSTRWSLNTSIPLFFAYRNQLYNPRGEYRVRSVGDMTVGARRWLFRPPTESGANVSFGINLKLPTGEYNATGRATNAQGQIITATADQSIQAGDGGVGFSVDMQAFQPFVFDTTIYLSGSYLFNPRDTNGVTTNRARPLESVMSVADQYLYRGGIARAVPGVRGLVLSFGGRMEGVPVRDAFGKSNGFRRPGYAISLDPGFLYQRWGSVFSVSVPFAVERNRRRSVTDRVLGIHGDAAFADYALVLGFARRF